MKNIFAAFAFLLFIAPKVEAQMGYTAPRSAVTVLVEDNSYLKIQGKTNVNNFSCSFKDEIPKDTIDVSIRQNGDKLVLTNAVLKVPVNGFDCGNPVMNNDLQNLLRQEEHPQIIIRIKSIEPSQLTASAGDLGFTDLGYAWVEFELAGVKNEYRIPLNSYNELIDQYYLGKKTINITDFKLTPPKKFLGLVKVEEEITIDFRLNLNFLY